MSAVFFYMELLFKYVRRNSITVDWGRGAASFLQWVFESLVLPAVMVYSFFFVLLSSQEQTHLRLS